MKKSLQHYDASPSSQKSSRLRGGASSLGYAAWNAVALVVGDLSTPERPSSVGA
jgi:hypothetical protein